MCKLFNLINKEHLITKIEKLITSKEYKKA